MNQANIIIRPCHPDDVPALYQIAINPAVSAGLLRMPTMAQDEAEAWLTRPPYHLTAELNGEIAGSVRLFVNQRPRLTHSSGLGIMVKQDFWGRGVGTALMASVLDLADDWLNLGRVELTVITTNTAAIHLYKKFNFVTEATSPMYSFGDGDYQDVYHMARLSPALQNSPNRSLPPLNLEQHPIADPKKLFIRAPVPDDAPQLHELMRHPAVACFTLQMPSQQIGAMVERLTKSNPNIHRFVAIYDGKLIGSCGLYMPAPLRRHHVGGIGMGVHPNYWGQGVGSALMAKTIDTADNWLNLRRLELEVNTDNPAGIHLYKKFGFQIEGTKKKHAFGNGGWTDSYLMARFKP